MEQNIERLSSGLHINKATDDDAGLATSERMNNQVRGMQQSNRNVQQSNNMLQTAECGLNEISNILGRMRELAVQSASDGINGDDRSSIDLEFQQLKAEINRISDATEYNNTKLLNGNIKSQSPNNGHADHTIDDVMEVALTVDSAQAGTYTFTVDSSNNNVTVSSTDSRSQTIAVDDITATNGTLTHTNREALDFTNLGVKVGTVFGDLTLNDLNGKKMIIDAGADIQVGANNVALEDRITFGISDHRSNQTGGLNLTSTDLTSTAINKVNDSRGNIGSDVSFHAAEVKPHTSAFDHFSCAIPNSRNSGGSDGTAPDCEHT